MKKPLISLITVVYNSEKWIEKTLQSVESQTCKNFEYIIIDGGSNDQTLTIIEQYQHLTTCLVSEPDKGIYDAMNKGLRLAKGDYVWFLNSGDRIFAQDTIAQMENLSRQNPDADVFYGQTELIDHHGNVLGMRRKKAPERLSVGSLRMGMMVCHQSFLVRREIAPEYDLGYRIVADYHWMLRVLTASRKNVYTNSTLSKFLQDGFSAQNRSSANKERFRVMCKHYGLFPTILAHVAITVRLFWDKILCRKVG